MVYHPSPIAGYLNPGHFQIKRNCVEDNHLMIQVLLINTYLGEAGLTHFRRVFASSEDNEPNWNLS